MEHHTEIDSVLNVKSEYCIDYVDSMGSDARVVNAARVSFSNQIPEDRDLETGDIRLITFLADHDHVSPFFHPTICLRIRMPIFIAREWFRHTIGFARNEVSRRYVTKGVECFLPEMVREKHPSKKQGSKDTPIVENDAALVFMKESMERSISDYRKLLALGAAPEQARLVLPQSMMTEFIETGSLAAYARLYGLRNHPDAQYEIRQYAICIGKILVRFFPVAWAALTNGKDNVIHDNGTTK
jgi:thymidylate synthase (FAD)